MKSVRLVFMTCGALLTFCINDAFAQELDTKTNVILIEFGTPSLQESEAADMDAIDTERNARCIKFWDGAYKEWTESVGPIEYSIVDLQQRMLSDPEHWISQLIVNTWMEIPIDLGSPDNWGSVEFSDELRYEVVSSFATHASNFVENDCTEWYWLEEKIWRTLAKSSSRADGVDMPEEAPSDKYWYSPSGQQWFFTWLLVPHPSLCLRGY